MVSSLATERLLIRACRASDVDALVVRRNHRQVAEFQNWTLPFSREQAQSLLERCAQMDGPQDNAWWMATITDPSDSVIYGDLALHLSQERRSAEVGYTLSHEHWGNGYASEALAALVQWIFAELPVTRIQGTLHPDNFASAMVMERCGFVFEAHSRLSCWVGDENTDDHTYAVTRDDWAAWRDRPRHVPTNVVLSEIDHESSHAVWQLRTHKSQERFVSPMPESFADALFPEVVDGGPLLPWMRAVQADGATVGFVMMALATKHHEQPYLWRLLIDRLHQRRGIGRRVLDLVVEHSREMGATALLTSWSEGRGSPRPFYERYGFSPTGRIVDEETEAALTL